MKGRRYISLFIDNNVMWENTLNLLPIFPNTLQQIRFFFLDKKVKLLSVSNLLICKSVLVINCSHMDEIAHNMTDRKLKSILQNITATGIK